MPERETGTTAELVTRGGGEETLGRRPEFDFLRAVVIALVVWHHAILAYATFAFLNPVNPVETFSPVVDSRRWEGFDLLAGFHDVFLMPLMFLVSGLFVWQSLERKGPAKYLLARARRLGIPFLVGVAVLIPLAYYPAQLNVQLVFGGDVSLGEFWFNLARRGFGTAGPLWFLWVLLGFDAVLVLLAPALRSLVPRLASARGIWERPWCFFVLFVPLSVLAYLPLALRFGPTTWLGFGPFKVQISRVLLYFLYLAAGLVLGAYGLDRSFLRRGGPLARWWWVWWLAGLPAFGVLITWIVTAPESSAVQGVALTVVCALFVFGSLALFLRFASSRSRVLDSLSANSYGIYVVHYGFVTWLQYRLLFSNLGAVSKACLVFSTALLLSWGSAAALRKIQAVRRIL